MFEHAGGTADHEIALLTAGYGMSRVLRPIQCWPISGKTHQ
jgi:hypothetical protein